MPSALLLAKAKFAETHQRVLGCLLFTCTARGPRADFFDSDCLDARTFLSDKIFGPDVPISGVYCNGEVGPNAMADHTAGTIFRQGHACIQGFTGVFGIFAVPDTKKTSALRDLLTLSDSPLSPQEFVTELLKGRRESL